MTFSVGSDKVCITSLLQWSLVCINLFSLYTLSKQVTVYNFIFVLHIFLHSTKN